MLKAMCWLICHLLVLPATLAHATDVPLVLQHGVKGYDGTRDVTISADGRLASENLGGTHQIDVWQFDGVVLIRFDLGSVPRNAIVKDASLELYCSSVGFEPEEKARAWPIGVYECTHEWREGSGIPNERPRKDGATLKSYNGSRPWPEGKVTAVAGELLGTTTHEGDRQGWCKWDLKPNLIQQWVAGGRPNRGFMVWGKPPGKAISFTSKDSTAAELRPILRLTVSLPDSDAAKLQASDIAWRQFVADCGKSAQQANEARTEQVFEEKYLGRSVNWSGIVDGTKRNPIGGGCTVFVRMAPTESAFGTFDLMLEAPDNLTDEVLRLNKGQRVDFTARFIRQGGLTLGHNLELQGIEPSKSPEQPRRKETPAPRGKNRR